jgi:hypothetical protein
MQGPDNYYHLAGNSTLHHSTPALDFIGVEINKSHALNQAHKMLTIT